MDINAIVQLGFTPFLILVVIVLARKVDELTRGLVDEQRQFRAILLEMLKDKSVSTLQRIEAVSAPNATPSKRP